MCYVLLSSTAIDTFHSQSTTTGVNYEVLREAFKLPVIVGKWQDLILQQNKSTTMDLWKGISSAYQVRGRGGWKMKERDDFVPN